MKESRRMLMLSSLSFSSIFVCSIFLRAGVVDDLDALPLLHVVDDELADDAVRDTASSLTSIDRSSRKLVAHSRLKSSRTRLLRRCTAPRRRRDGRLGLRLDVIEVGLRLDRPTRCPAPGTQLDEADDRRRSGGRQPRGLLPGRRWAAPARATAAGRRLGGRAWRLARRSGRRRRPPATAPEPARRRSRRRCRRRTRPPSSSWRGIAQPVAPERVLRGRRRSGRQKGGQPEHCQKTRVMSAIP